MSARSAPSVAVIGGGLAGLAAACALAGAGFRVRLYERRPYLGGRASSYQHPGTGEVVDNCQHVLLGCCTNLLDFYRRIGALHKIRWYDRLVFLEPGGRESVISPSWLPAPLHNSFSFLRAPCLGLRDKMGIAAAMLALAESPPQDTGEPFLAWLEKHGQTARAIERFWKVVLVRALNEDLERASSRYAALVFRESFLRSREAGRMGLPTVPLSELYGAAGASIQARGGQVELRAAVESVRPSAAGVKLCVGGAEQTADFAVLALPFQLAASVLPDTPEARPLRAQLELFESSPITGIHFWFDRRITDLDHAVLLDRTIQWMFHKSSFQFSVSSFQKSGQRAGPSGQQEEASVAGNSKLETENSYIELVVSSSKSLVDKPRQEIEYLALRELAEFFPAVRNARLLKSTVIKEIYATYSPRPGVDRYRPSPHSPWGRLFLAGDWVATGWPATMEGAVRSGYRAAEALARAAGVRRRFLVPELPARGLMRVMP